jgi:hypothetical protein
VRTRSQARVTKVEYPGGLASNYDALYSTNNCNPRYDILKYVLKKSCILPCVPPVIPPPPPVYVRYFGGVAYTGILEGGDAYSEMPLLLDAITYIIGTQIINGQGGPEFIIECGGARSAYVDRLICGDFPTIYSDDPTLTGVIYGGQTSQDDPTFNIILDGSITRPVPFFFDGYDSVYGENVYTGETVITNATVILSGGNSNL